jgi:hypothetical protein
VTSPLRILVTGLMAAYPLGGMAWHYFQYVLGLARLGHDVYYVEDSGRDPYNPVEGGPSPDCGYNVAYLAGVMARFGLDRRWGYRSHLGGRRWFGLPDPEREEVLGSADLLLNVSGSLDRPEEYRQVRRLAYLDTDPVFTQLKLRRNPRFRARVDAHDVHFSFGERLAQALPATGQRWRATRQPVVLSQWRAGTPCQPVYTTVMSWTSYRAETDGSRTYGHKDVEFLRFLELPRLIAPAALEVAAAPGRTRAGPPLELLAQNGWRVVDPAVVCPDLDSYRAYVESSKAEWSVAKNAYVQAGCGWFSERSACYLAAGRPAIVQDTGFSAFLPVGEGLLPFTTVAEAVAAVRQVEAHYPRHARAARTIAEEYFNSDKVLTRLIEEALHGD